MEQYYLQNLQCLIWFGCLTVICNPQILCVSWEGTGITPKSEDMWYIYLAELLI